MALHHRDIVEGDDDDPARLENGIGETTPLLLDSESSESASSSESSSTTRGSEAERAKSADGVLVDGDQKGGRGSAAAVLSLLMIGVFIASADTSLVMATVGTISSKFNRLEYAPWLVTSYILAMSASQPVASKLTDVFGRKYILLVSYVIFAIGNMVSGWAQNMWQVIIGRAIAGLGGSGMNVIVSILITDLVPKIEVATWRSYVNVVSTTARSIGGPLGGWLADTVGWRWSFLGQVPLTALAFILVAYKLPNTTGQPSDSIPGIRKSRAKLARIDFVGAILFSAIIVAFILALDVPSRGVPWNSPLVISLFIASAVLGLVFLWFEEKHATEPIFPPRLLLQRNVATSYAIAALQIAAQLALMFSVPLYFQVTAGASNTEAGTHLVPAVVGNAIGALLTGFIIKKTGKYKATLFFAALCACTCYTLLIFTWHGKTTPLASLEIFPGGFGTGITGTAAFVALTAYIPHTDVAVATGGLFLAMNIGMIFGVSLSSSMQRGMLVKQLIEKGVKDKVIEHVLKDVLYTRRLEGELKETVIQSYVLSLGYSHGFSFVCSALAGLVSFAMWEGGLE